MSKIVLSISSEKLWPDLSEENRIEEVRRVVDELNDGPDVVRVGRFKVGDIVDVKASKSGLEIDVMFGWNDRVEARTKL